MGDSVRIEVTEDDLHMAMSELYNCGEFELMDRHGVSVTLVSVDKDEDEEGTECDECEATIPAPETDDESIVNTHHKTTCSLYGVKEK